MEKRAQNSVREMQKEVMGTIRKIMSDLEREKQRLVEKEKSLQKYEKELLEKEKVIEQEMDNFSKEIAELVAHNQKSKGDFRF